jgi:DNA-directed RNA polymerase subunit RPC12/RpoP
MSRKREAKRRKTKMLRNKKLVKRYPWIAIVDWHRNKVKDYSYTMYDFVPIGWKRAFGKIMLEEYREVLIRNHYLNDFQWIEVKEKYGTLRLYSNGAPGEVLRLESKYDYTSGFFCISCGRINSPVLTNGWVEPLCEDCYNKRIVKQRRWHEKNCKGTFTYTPYKDLKKGEQKIEMFATYKCYSPEQGNYEEKRDYS